MSDYQNVNLRLCTEVGRSRKETFWIVVVVVHYKTLQLNQVDFGVHWRICMVRGEILLIVWVDTSSHTKHIRTPWLKMVDWGILMEQW